MEFDTGREAERRVLIFLGAIALLVLLYLFLHGLWEIYQPGGLCQMSPYLVRLYTGLHLYTPHYYCDWLRVAIFSALVRFSDRRGTPMM